MRIDTLRGFACMLLVAFHVVGSSPSSGLSLSSTHPLYRLNDVLSHLRMPLFCFLSGFVYALRPYNGEPSKFFRGKARRLLVPMLVVGTFFAVLQSVVPGTHTPRPDWHLLHIIPVAHYWFLESIFLILMVTACLEHFGFLKTIHRFGGVWVASVLLFLVNPMPDYLGMTGAVYLLPFFLAGLACNRFSHRLDRRTLSLVAVVFAVLCLRSAIAQELLLKGGIVSLLLGITACILLLSCRFESRLLAAIGIYSFGIYLFHPVFTAASRMVLHRVGADSTALLIASGMSAGIVGSIMTTLVLRRIPWGVWALGESRRRDLTEGSGFAHSQVPMTVRTSAE